MNFRFEPVPTGNWKLETHNDPMGIDFLVFDGKNRGRLTPNAVKFTLWGSFTGLEQSKITDLGVGCHSFFDVRPI